jgi:membrane protein YdbS with pleckstrin-like domain
MFKLSFLLLLLTTPFLSSEIYYGIPFWVYTSLGITTIYAIVLVVIIETRWHKLRDKNE